MKGFSCAVVVLLLYAVPVFAEADGEELYGEYCQSCHGEDKAGVQGYQGSLAEFTDRLNGVTEDMPDFTDFFEEDEIVALHVYVTEAQ